MTDGNRKKFLIDNRVQGTLAWRLMYYWAAFVLIGLSLGFILQFLSHPLLPLKDHLANIWWNHGAFMVVMLLMTPIVVLDSFKLSNRFAGPVYRLRKTLREMRESGQVRPLRFRQNDFWQELADEFNVTMDQLREKYDIPGPDGEHVGQQRAAKLSGLPVSALGDIPATPEQPIGF